MNLKLQAGDLEFVEMTQHSDIPKTWGIFGIFKGSNESVLLARIGEGSNDPRSEELIKLTVERVTETIIDLYGTMAFLRQTSIDK